jgi:hypothetical protein
MNGLGDTIAAILEATKIDVVAKAVLGEDCGCKARQEALNKLFPYGKTKETDGSEQEIRTETKG